jgi:hypothetical protein
MKKINILLLCVLFLGLTSCDDSGVTQQNLSGEEANLPEALKGLKVYRVSTGGLDYVNVAVLNGQVNSTTYRVGKSTRSTIIINKQNNKVVEVSQILIENDSLIVARK